jgi:hypothetical protein
MTLNSTQVVISNVRSVFDLTCSLSDRKPVDPEDEVAVMIIPDHQMLEAVERITSQLSDDPVCNLCLIRLQISADLASKYIYIK